MANSHISICISYFSHFPKAATSQLHRTAEDYGRSARAAITLHIFSHYSHLETASTTRTPWALCVIYQWEVDMLWVGAMVNLFPSLQSVSDSVIKHAGCHWWRIRSKSWMGWWLHSITLTFNVCSVDCVLISFAWFSSWTSEGHTGLVSLSSLCRL